VRKSVIVFFVLAAVALAEFLYTSQEQESPLILLKKSETSKVCMVNNAYFASPQIPVEVNGKTYYGCCENCKKTLNESLEARTAIDPVSKTSVDKSDAFIAKNKQDQVVYFESRENFELFRRSYSHKEATEEN
jgi:YHS domain-containing protein